MLLATVISEPDLQKKVKNSVVLAKPVSVCVLGVGCCVCAADLYTHKLLCDGSKYRPHLVLLGGSSGQQKGRGHCSSQVELPHLLSCS